MLAGGFAGEVYLVNPHQQSIGGRRCYRRYRLAARGARACGDRNHARHRAGLDRRARQERHARRRRHHGGLQRRAEAGDARSGASPIACASSGRTASASPCPGSGCNANFGLNRPQAGKLAFLSQSGALITGILDWAAARGIGFSYVVSMGDMADVDVGDLLDFLAADVATSAILLYLETIPAARKFMSAARSAARVKPVIVIKSGRYRGIGARRGHAYRRARRQRRRGRAPRSAAPGWCGSRSSRSCSPRPRR